MGHPNVLHRMHNKGGDGAGRMAGMDGDWFRNRTKQPPFS